MKNFDVVLMYRDQPNFKSRVMARDNDHAIRLTTYNAMANGWPKDYIEAKVQEDPI